MTRSGDQAQPVDHTRASTIAIAWVVTLLVSSLGDIACFELTGAVPLWLLWAKAGLLGALIVLTWLWEPIKALRPFLVMLLAIALLTRASDWLWNSPASKAWWSQQSFTVTTLAFQALEAGVALLLVGLLFLLRKRRQRFFLVRGDMNAMAEPIKLLGQKLSSPLWRFGLIFTLVVIVGQVFMIILPLSPTSDTVRRLVPFVPLILLLAAANGVTEEIILRAAPISTVYEVVGKSNAIWLAAVLFGLAHYIGGIPSGIAGVLITAFLGWFFGKCMLDSRGFFWPWLFHAVQDILPFTLIFLAAIS
jgi:membrane protease YdiL (CAAX protease family)